MSRSTSPSLSFEGGVSTMRASEAAVSTITDVVHRLNADCGRGLTESQVEERRQLHGHNEFEIKEDDPLWRKYLNQVRGHYSYTKPPYTLVV